MRLTIIGLPGSGKSTLAEAISNKLAIPHIHIDRFWFEAGGRQGSHDTPNIEQVRAYVKEKAMAAIDAESWVSDGFYSRIQPEIAKRADKVLFLDIPLWQRLLNHAIRILNRPERHTQVSMWEDIKFFREIIRRTFANGPKLRDFLLNFQEKVTTFKNRKEIDLFLKNLNN
ncbi:MAG TPA: AAA family ATPase [Candidatus Andersenbacteria bacterium]|nr:AAA family ATPase [Candidatus Andersenbacteria bacterium]